MIILFYTMLAFLDNALSSFSCHRAYYPENKIFIFALVELLIELTFIAVMIKL